MEVISVSYFEDGHRSVGVACSGCICTHQIVWPSGFNDLSGEMECGNYAVLKLPVWVRNPRRDRTRHRFDPAQAEPVSAGIDRDENAVDVPVPNWTE